MTDEQKKEFFEALADRSIFNNPNKRHLVRLLWEDNQKLREENEKSDEIKKLREKVKELENHINNKK